MTIQLLTDYPFGRYTIPAGRVVNVFNSATEAGLIASKQAIASAAAATWTPPDETPIYDQLTPAEVQKLRPLVSEAGIVADEYTDQVTLTATGIVHPMPGRLSTITVVSGLCDLALADGAGTGTAGIRAIATYAGLAAGDVVPFPGDGLPFVNALLATITGTATLRFEVI